MNTVRIFYDPRKALEFVDGPCQKAIWYNGIYWATGDREDLPHGDVVSGPDTWFEISHRQLCKDAGF
jgi:hypothetical protein